MPPTSPELDEKEAEEGVTRFTPPRLEAALWLSLTGRVSRRTLWLWFIIPVYAIALLAAGLDALTGATPTNAIAEAYRSLVGDAVLSLSALAGPISNVAVMAYFWPITAGMVKRLHDLGFSGWFWAAYMVVVLGSWAIFLLSPQSVLTVALVVLSTLVACVVSVFLYFIPGTPGPNQYGPDPLGRP